MRPANKRPSIHETMLQVAAIMSHRGTCARRQVGAVITDKNNQILSTGYNGVPRGWTHCKDDPCAGAMAESGKHLDECNAVHAEINALAQCPQPQVAYNLYCTTAPCISCIKALINTGIMWIYFNQTYPHVNKSADIWSRSHPGRQMCYVGSKPPHNGL